jgi:hypothetical protein
MNSFSLRDNRISARRISAILVTWIVVSASSCHCLRVKRRDLDTEALSMAPDRTVIVHMAGQTWQLGDVRFDERRRELTGIRLQLPPELRFTRLDYPEGYHLYRRKDGDPSNLMQISITGYQIDSLVHISLVSIDQIKTNDEALDVTNGIAILGSLSALLVVSLVTFTVFRL